MHITGHIQKPISGQVGKSSLKYELFSKTASVHFIIFANHIHVEKAVCG